MTTVLNRTLALSVAAALALTASTAWAGPKQRDNLGYYDYARVVSSTPLLEEVNEPRKECWTEQAGVTRETVRDRSYGGAIIGGLVGGILGNQLGKGNGRKAAAVLGATTGAIVGDNIDNDDVRYVSREYPQVVERCRTVDNWSRRITGYDVVYRYHGREYTTFLPFDPGPDLKLRVNLSIAER